MTDFRLVISVNKWPGKYLAKYDTVSVIVWLLVWINKCSLCIGKLIGHFYGPDGSPTVALLKAQKLYEVGLAAQKEEQEQQKIFPPCNSQWSEKDGTTVWCSDKRQDFYGADISAFFSILLKWISLFRIRRRQIVNQYGQVDFGWIFWPKSSFYILCLVAHFDNIFVCKSCMRHQGWI